MTSTTTLLTPTPQAPPLHAVVAAAVHPSVAAARAGCPDEPFTIAPEVFAPQQTPLPAGFRQAARFRVYGLDAAGDVVTELTTADAELVWTVQPRNSRPQHIERRPCTVTGRGAGGPGENFAPDDSDTLGGVRTDLGGRLLVVGGTDSSPATAVEATVDVRVTLGGRELPRATATALLLPPRATAEPPLRTAYDLACDAARTPGRASFTLDVLPLLRAVATRHPAALDGVPGLSGTDLTDRRCIALLASAADERTPLRRGVLDAVRAVVDDGELAPHQLAALKDWADGRFEADRPGTLTVLRRLVDAPAAEQPGILERAALSDIDPAELDPASATAQQLGAAPAQPEAAPEKPAGRLGRRAAAKRKTSRPKS